MARKTVDYLIYETTYYYYIRISLNKKTITMLKEKEYNVTNIGQYYIENCYHKADGWKLEQIKILRDKFLKKYEEMGLRRFKKSPTYLA